METSIGATVGGVVNNRAPTVCIRPDLS